MRSLFIFLLLCASPVLAHEWYPSFCCNERDCTQVPVEDVVIVDGKYVVTWQGQTVEFDKANPSPDGRYHMCVKGDGSIRELTPNGHARYMMGVMPTSNVCFWAPQGA